MGDYLQPRRTVQLKLTCRQTYGFRAKRAPVSHGEKTDEGIHGRKFVLSLPQASHVAEGRHLFLVIFLPPLLEPKANEPTSDVLRPRNPLLRLVRRRLHHQIPRAARDRLCIAMR
jgi:hypothetical protein